MPANILTDKYKLTLSGRVRRLGAPFVKPQGKFHSNGIHLTTAYATDYNPVIFAGMRCAEVGAPYGQAIYNLLPVAVIFVLCPSARIIGNIIIPYHIIVFIAHNMVIKRPLPQIASGILIGKPFQCRNYAWHQFRRARRPRRAIITQNRNQHMNMVWHDNIGINRHIWICLRNRSDIMFNNFTDDR